MNKHFLAGKRNYKNGAKKEYRVIKKLKEEGFDIAQRSAGSHSPVDVWAVRHSTREIRLIQCKPKSTSDNKKQAIEEENKWLKGVFEVSFVVL